LAASSAGQRWLGNAISPIAATTAVSARSTGIPAATAAPNAASRIASVIGIDRYSARLKSRPTLSSSSFDALASPNSPTKYSGCAFCAPSTVASTLPMSALSATWNCTRTERPSLEIWPPFPPP
jgi:hypothetical protein